MSEWKKVNSIIELQSGFAFKSSTCVATRLLLCIFVCYEALFLGSHHIFFCVDRSGAGGTRAPGTRAPGTRAPASTRVPVSTRAALLG